MDQLDKILMKLEELKSSITSMEKQQAIYNMQLESEKGNRNRGEQDIWVELKELKGEIKVLRDFKNNIQGRIMVTMWIAGFAIGAFVTLLMKKL